MNQNPPPGAVANIVKAATAQNRMASSANIKSAKAGVSILGVIFSVFLLATSVNGYIAVTSNLNNKCNDNTVGVKIATNRTTRWFMVSMIVISILMLIMSFMGVFHFTG